MLDELIAIVPNAGGTAAFAAAIVALLAGLAMWITGARFSRPVLTLSAVTIGGAVGLELPKWFGWNVSGAGPAVGAAVVLGVSAFVLHRMWVGLTLGAVLCLWTFFATWILLRNGQSLQWPEVKGGDVFTPMGTFWHSLPSNVTSILPYVSFVAVISGLAMAILWDRFTLLLTWSAAGVTTALIGGIATIEHARPSLLGSLPAKTWVQALSVVGLVVMGGLIQTRSAPKRAFAPAGKAPKGDKPGKGSKD